MTDKTAMLTEVTYAEIRFAENTDTNVPPNDQKKLENNSEVKTEGLISHFNITIALAVAVCILMITLIGIAIAYASCAKQLKWMEIQLDKVATSSGVKNINKVRQRDICAKDWTTCNESCYFFSKEKKSFDTSKQLCEDINATLIVFEDVKEQEIVRCSNKENLFYWIGLTKNESSEMWNWINNLPYHNLSLFNNSNHTGKNCASISQAKWYAEDCSQPKYWICEKKAL
ncbi:CD209 antigen-like protein C [Erpetoichthys calabaricus]|uniref:CD209 antigen-like protein C n=1 Tax=Erpetoichthys calabaricus TaxID=27687 RepID=UPI00109FBC32|nr:CD209 antigen-like protein C [Erpetoichthys calabaricus]